MVDKALRAIITETYPDTIFLDDYACDNSIVGVTTNGAVVYDYDKMIEEVAEDGRCGVIEAIEWIDANAASVRITNPHVPVIIETNRETFEESRSGVKE